MVVRLVSRSLHPLALKILAVATVLCGPGLLLATPARATTVAVAISPSAVILPVGGMQVFTAMVENDSTNLGVAWSESGGGSVQQLGPVTALYTAANSLSETNPVVYVVATSVADPSIFAEATVTVVPEPSTALLFTVGVLGLAVKGRRRV
jgi:hypothetical protein